MLLEFQVLGRKNGFCFYLKLCGEASVSRPVSNGNTFYRFGTIFVFNWFPSINPSPLPPRFLIKITDFQFTTSTSTFSLHCTYCFTSCFKLLNPFSSKQFHFHFQPAFPFNKLGSFINNLNPPITFLLFYLHPIFNYPPICFSFILTIFFIFNSVFQFTQGFISVIPLPLSV